MAPFEFSVTVPTDLSLAAMIRDVVAHGARHAGSPDDAALEFACRVEDAVRAVAGGGARAAAPDPTVTVVVRLDGVSPGGPLQVVITRGAHTRTLALDI